MDLVLEAEGGWRRCALLLGGGGGAWLGPGLGLGLGLGVGVRVRFKVRVRFGARVWVTWRPQRDGLQVAAHPRVA